MSSGCVTTGVRTGWGVPKLNRRQRQLTCNNVPGLLQIQERARRRTNAVLTRWYWREKDGMEFQVGRYCWGSPSQVHVFTTAVGVRQNMCPKLQASHQLIVPNQHLPALHCIAADFVALSPSPPRAVPLLRIEAPTKMRPLFPASQRYSHYPCPSRQLAWKTLLKIRGHKPCKEQGQGGWLSPALCVY